MKSENALITLVAAILVVSLAIVLISNDALSQPYTYEPPDAYFSIRDVDVKPIEVTSAQIEVNVTAYIDRGDGKTNNPTMQIRVINSDTRLLETEVFAQIPESDQGKTVTASQKLKVDRNGNYELNILLYNNKSIRDSGAVAIKGLSALTPAAKKSGIMLTNIDFVITGTSAGRASVRPDAYLENRGVSASDNLNMVVKARQAESNILADKGSIETGTIASEATAVRSVQLEVPDGYNYMVVVELWKGDVLINTWEKALMLAPTKTVPKESAEKKMNIEVSKFVREGNVQTASEAGMAYAAAATTMQQEPGFEAIAAVAALIMVIALRRRS
ncbi:MAG: hypothetical protein KKI06_09005 [Euryarchaeota archaeon]|nr:hypothetical protein [Euryarchaeota archaeon]